LDFIEVTYKEKKLKKKTDLVGFAFPLDQTSP